ncbi:MAG: glutamate racemase [Vicinamibacterales bacterium]
MGVFDSGVGGLSVLREIRRELPAEDLIYVADSAFAPYGSQSDETIVERSIAIARFLTARSAKAIVVACNTATAVAVDTLRSMFAVPVVAMEPAVKPATLNTRSAVVGVLATTHTLASSKFSRLLAAYGADVEILLQPCPGLVEQVEKADLAGPHTLALIESYVAPLLARRADTLVLGCTHYPFLIGSIRQVAGPGIEIIDPSPAVARELRRRLKAAGLLSQEAGPGTEQFWTSATPESVRPVMGQLWTRDISVQHLP